MIENYNIDELKSWADNNAARQSIVRLIEMGVEPNFLPEMELVSKGVKPGSCVAAFTRDGLSFVTTMLGAYGLVHRIIDETKGTYIAFSLDADKLESLVDIQSERQDSDVILGRFLGYPEEDIAYFIAHKEEVRDVGFIYDTPLPFIFHDFNQSDESAWARARQLNERYERALSERNIRILLEIASAHKEGLRVSPQLFLDAH